MRITVDAKGSLPPSEQIAEQIRFAIAAGELIAGARLPSVRGLAQSAVVNPNTVAKAYRELEREGTVETRPGDGVFVARGAPRRCDELRTRLIEERLRHAIAEAERAGLPAHRIEGIVARALAHAAAQTPEEART